MNETMFDLITESALDSEIKTAGALVDSYAKAMTILESAETDAEIDAFGVFQEAATEENGEKKETTTEEKKEAVNKGLVNSVKRLLKALASKIKRQEAHDPNAPTAKDKATLKKYDITGEQIEKGATVLFYSGVLIAKLMPYVQEWRVNKELDRLVNKLGKGESVDKMLNSIDVAPGGVICIRSQYNLSKVKSWFEKAYKYLQFESGNGKKLGDAASAKRMIRKSVKSYTLSSFEKWYTSMNNGVIGKLGQLVSKDEEIDESKLTPEYATALKTISELYTDVWVNGIGGSIKTIKEAIFTLVNDSESRLGLKYTLIGGKAKFVVVGKKKQAGIKDAAVEGKDKDSSDKEEPKSEEKKSEDTDDKKDDKSDE